MKYRMWPWAWLLLKTWAWMLQSWHQKKTQKKHWLSLGRTLHWSSVHSGGVCSWYLAAKNRIGLIIVTHTWLTVTGRGWEYVYGAEAMPKYHFPLSELPWLYSMQVVHHCLTDSMPSVSTKHFYCSQTMTLHCASGNSAPCTDRWVCSFQKTNEISLISKRTLWPGVRLGTHCLVPHFAHSFLLPWTLETFQNWSVNLRSAKKILWMNESKSAETLIELFLWYSTRLNTL